MPRRFVALLLLFLACATAGAAKNFPWEEFAKRTLRAAVEIDVKAAARIENRGEGFVLPGDAPVYSKAVVIYSGLARAIPQERRELLDRWAILHNYAPAYIERYEQEYLFFEGDRKYWLPVQKSVAEHLVRDLREGRKVELYYLSGVGALRSGKTWDWILLVQEYQLPPG